MKPVASNRRKLPPLLGSGNLRVVMDLRANTYRIGTDLHESELYAIGYVTVQWAHLEHMLLISSLLLADTLKVNIPKDINNLSFNKRLRAWRMLIEKISNRSKRTKFIRIHDRIANIQDKRHKITHGLWDWGYSNPVKIRASSFRAPHAFEQHFGFKKMCALGDSIGEILFELHYPRGPKSLRHPMAYMSREFFIAIANQKERDKWGSEEDSRRLTRSLDKLGSRGDLSQTKS